MRFLTGMAQGSSLETIVFLVVLGAAVWSFCRQLRVTLRTILESKPDAGFKLRPKAPRVRRFVREVLLQSKVIRQRPLAGFAHALVFWGFCAFGLVTLNHLTQGVGFAFLTYTNFWGRLYNSLAFLFAMAVTLGITVLAVRRFLARPKWLGARPSLESGLIAALILVLMVTFMQDYADGGEGGRVRWWLHTLALAAFLALIPRTKHLHLLLSPATIFLKHGGFGRIPPLAGDEDFGLETGRDVTRLTVLQAFSCVECGRCMEHCPASATGKTLNPKEIALGLRAYLRANGPGAAEPLLGAHLSQEAVFQCTTCGACEFQCPVGIEHLPLIVGLRRGAVNTGRWEDPRAAQLFVNLERYGNPLGASSLERDKFITKAGLPLYDGSQEYCLWLGCMGSYDPQGRETVAALARVLRHLGISFGVLRKERCTGDAARRLGNDLAFQQLAEANIEALGGLGVRKILSTCPHCVRTIGEDWRELGVAFEIEHHSILLAKHAGRLPLAVVAQPAVYHDPCYLGRYQGVYNEPRYLLSVCADYVDPPRARERSFCCGAGGGLAFLGEEQGQRVSHARAAELLGTGAPAVAVACPFCRNTLGDAMTALEPQPPVLLDIAQIAAAGLPPEHAAQDE